MGDPLAVHSVPLRDAERHDLPPAGVGVLLLVLWSSLDWSRRPIFPTTIPSCQTQARYACRTSADGVLRGKGLTCVSAPCSSFAAAIILILFATAAARADNVVLVTSLGGLSANDTVVWSQLGADATDFAPNPGFTSTNGLTGSLSLMGPHSLVAVVCPETPCSWNPVGLQRLQRR